VEVTHALSEDPGWSGELRCLAHGAVACTIAMLISTLSAGCDPSLSERECQQLLDRYVELLVKAHSPETSPQEIMRLQSLARERLTNDAEAGHCGGHVSRRAFNCAMHEAESADELERCLL
jgi:hypothetical protein